MDKREDQEAQRQPERFLPLPQAALNILLALLEEEAHGLGIRKAIEERTGGEVRMRAGTLYEALHRLDRDGLIAELEEPPSDQATSRWRYYRITAFGRQVLRAEMKRLDAIVAYAKSHDMAPESEGS
ncbi:MAG TPA: PadR family transcriptional regulator [Acidobacteriota bacterium]|nr:PadR family transcriptional regulator [Acidobacteriota bacterium]